MLPFFGQRRSLKFVIEFDFNLDVAKSLKDDPLEGEIHQILTSKVIDIRQAIRRELKKRRYK